MHYENRSSWGVLGSFSGFDNMKAELGLFVPTKSNNKFVLFFAAACYDIISVGDLTAPKLLFCVAKQCKMHTHVVALCHAQRVWENGALYSSASASRLLCPVLITKYKLI